MKVPRPDYNQIVEDFKILGLIAGVFIWFGFLIWFLMETSGEIDLVPKIVEDAIVAVWILIVALSLLDRYTEDKREWITVCRSWNNDE